MTKEQFTNEILEKIDKLEYVGRTTTINNWETIVEIEREEFDKISYTIYDENDRELSNGYRVPQNNLIDELLYYEREWVE